MKNDCAVYQIINERTLRFYIGSAKDFSKRYGLVPNWARHKNPELKQDAINGDEFIYCKMQECTSHAEALCMEQWWLDFYEKNSLWNCLYNKNKCVWKLKCDNTGRKASEEEKIRHSAIMKTVMNKPEVKIRLTAALKIAMNTPEAKANNSAAQREAQNKPEAKLRNSIAQKEAQNRPEVKLKKSATMKIVCNTPEARAKNSAIRKIVMNKPEVRLKLSVALKEVSKKPEVKFKRSVAQKEAQNRPEVKIKHSGENSKTAKLTNQDVLKIREKYMLGDITINKLAEQYHVSGKAIYKIIHRETWKLI